MMALNDIGIVEYNNIIRQIKDVAGIDLGEFAATSLWRRITRCIQIHNLRFADALMARIRENPEFMDTFFYDISVESTEFFRDPEMWYLLREKIIPELFNKFKKISVWFPSCVSGDELYSFLILLHESGWVNQVQIHATCPSKKNLEIIQSGITRRDKVSLSNDNYKRFGGIGNFPDYFTSRGPYIYKSLISTPDMVFSIAPLPFITPPDRQFHLIFFRNQLLYFGPNLQNQVLAFFHQMLIRSGLLIIGHKEQLEVMDAVKNFLAVDTSERIFQKA